MTTFRNLIPSTGLAITILLFAYGWATVEPEDSVGTPLAVLGVPGTVLLCATIVMTMVTMCIAACRAHREGSWLWFSGVILFWPLSYVYTLAVNRDR